MLPRCLSSVHSRGSQLHITEAHETMITMSVSISRSNCATGTSKRALISEFIQGACRTANQMKVCIEYVSYGRWGLQKPQRCSSNNKSSSREGSYHIFAPSPLRVTASQAAHRISRDGAPTEQRKACCSLFLSLYCRNMSLPMILHSKCARCLPLDASSTKNFSFSAGCHFFLRQS